MSRRTARKRGELTATQSVPPKSVDRQGESPLLHAGRLGLAVLRDKRLRRSALSIAVLSGLIVYGAAEHPAEISLYDIAATLDSSYDSVHRALGKLATLGYVQLARGKQGRRRLSMRVVWPDEGRER